MKTKVIRKSFEKRREDILNSSKKKCRKAQENGTNCTVPVRKVKIGYMYEAMLTMRPLSAKEIETLSKRFFVTKRKDGKVILTHLPINAIAYNGAAVTALPIVNNLVIKSNGKEK